MYPISRTLLTDINCSMLAVAPSSSPALLVLTSLLLTMTGNASLIANWKYRNKIYQCWFHQYLTSHGNKNVDIKFSAHEAFLEWSSSGTLKIERLESQIIYSFGSNKTKGPKRDSQNQLRSLCLRKENSFFLLIITLFRNCKFQ